MGIGSIISRGFKMYPEFVLGTGQEAFAQAMKNTIKGRKAANLNYFESVWKGSKDGFKAAETLNKNNIKNNGGFFKNFWKELKTTPEVLSKAWQDGGSAAKAAGKSGLWGSFKGAGKGLLTKMPLIGSLMMVGFELPNLFKAFTDKDGGVVTGTVEVGKTAARLGAGATFAAIGQAIIPIPGIGALIGGALGWMAGDLLMSKIVGKSFSEKKAEQQEIASRIHQGEARQYQQQQELMNQYNQNNPFASQNINPLAYNPSTMTQQQLMAMKQMLYGAGAMNDDFMMNASGLNRIV